MDDPQRLDAADTVAEEWMILHRQAKARLAPVARPLRHGVTWAECLLTTMGDLGLVGEASGGDAAVPTRTHLRTT